MALQIKSEPGQSLREKYGARYDEILSKRGGGIAPTPQAAPTAPIAAPTQPAPVAQTQETATVTPPTGQPGGATTAQETTTTTQTPTGQQTTTDTTRDASVNAPAPNAQANMLGLDTQDSKDRRRTVIQSMFDRGDIDRETAISILDAPLDEKPTARGLGLVEDGRDRDKAKAERFTGLKGLPASIRGKIEAKKESLNTELDRLDAEIIKDGEIGQGEVLKAGGVGALKSLGAGASLVGEGLLDAALRTVKTLMPEGIEKDGITAFKELGGEIAKTKAGEVGLQALSEGVEAWGAFESKFPNAASAIGSVFQIAEVIPAFKGGRLAAKAGGEFVETGIEAGKVGLKKRAAKATRKKGEDIAGKTLPKATSTQKELALLEGRFTDPTVAQKLFGGQRQIIPTERAIKDGELISEIIKKPKLKNAQEFIGQLDEAGTKIAKKVRPRLREVPIDKAKTDEILKIGAEVEKEILGDPKILSDLTGADKKAFAKFQDKFTNAKTLEDVWDARIEWDRFTKSNVKQAGELSDSVLQKRKDVWIDGRKKINKLIDDLAGDGVGFKGELNKMRALNDAKQNIATNANEFAKIKGAIPQWLKRTVGGAAATAVGVSALN